MNRKPNFAGKLISVLVGLTLIVSASAPTAQGDGIRRSVHPQTGMLTFLGADPANPVHVSAAMGYGLAPEARGNSILDVYGLEFGITNPPRELSVMKTNNAEGRSMVRYQQVYNKIPVMGGELIVNMKEDGSLLSINGEVSPDLKIDVLPRVDAQKAKQAALTAIAKVYKLKATDLTVTAPELWIYDARLLNGNDLTPAHLVWRMEVSSATAPIRELVLVNAKSGGISLHFNQIDTAWTGESIEIATPLETKNSTPAENLVRRDYDDALDVHTTRLTSTSDLNTSPDKGDYQPLGAPVPGTNLFVNGTSGNDANDCLYPASACLTIGGAIGKPQAEGNSIYVAEGMHTGSEIYVIWVNKNVNLSGGWSSDFTAQPGYSTIDGENVRRGVIIEWNKNVVMDHFIVQHGYSNNDGGGVYVYGNLTLDHSIIQNNTTVNSSGGGIFVQAQGLLLLNSRVSNNTATYGGGMYGGGTIINSIIANNTAMWGGGVYAYYDLEINNTTIATNKAEKGGGIYVFLSTVVINNSTIAENLASVAGSGIYNSYSNVLSMKNSVVVGDKDTCNHIFYDKIISLGNNLFNQTCDITLVSGDLNVSDPKIGPYLPLQGYLPLHADSPAVNHGNSSTCYGTSDQRGQPRVGVCDIGAFEYTAPGAPAVILAFTGDHQNGPPSRDYAKPLTAVVLDGNANLVSGVSVTFTSPSNGPTVLFKSTGTHTNVVTTGTNGSASTSTLIANSEYGAFSVQAAVSGLLSTSFSLENLMWTVLPTGSDSNTCKSPADPCLAIQAAVSKSSAGDTVYVSADTYTGTGSQVVQLTKDVTLSGGWNSTFDTQSGKTTIDGEGARRGITIGSWLDFISVNVDHFIVTNGKNPGTGNSLQTNGGGIYVVGGNNLSIRESVISGNRAVNGAGISAEVNTIIDMDKTTIQNNYATSDGGGIYTAGIVDISNSSIHSNTAVGGLGGGIYASNVDTASVITNTTIAQNIAIQGGGVVAMNMDLLHVSLVYNSARFTGGIASQSSSSYANIRLGNTILAYNDSLFKNGDQYQRGNCTSLAGIKSLGAVIVYPDCLGQGEEFLSVDPKLDAFLPELGFAPLKSDSPAINAGNPAICISGDQRGQPRNGPCDIGAFEVIANSGTPSQILYVGGGYQRVFPNSDFAHPLGVMVLDADGNPVANESVTFIAPGSGASAVFADSGTNTTSVITDGGGNAITSVLTAKGPVGDYVVSANHGTGTVNFNLSNGAWYTAPAADGGNDANDCKSPVTPCVTLHSIFSRPDYYSDDGIRMMEGSYPATNADVMFNKSTALSGGWDANFLHQTSVSTLDFTAYPSRIITVPWNVAVSFDHLDFLKTRLVNHGNSMFGYGSIRNGKSVSNLGYLTIENSTIFGNTSTNSSGGGVENSGFVHFWNSTITANSASSIGGGVYNYRYYEVGTSTSGRITLGNTIIVGNTASSGPDCAGNYYSSQGNNLVGIGCGFNQTGSDLVGKTTSPIRASDVLVPAPVQDGIIPSCWEALPSMRATRLMLGLKPIPACQPTNLAETGRGGCIVILARLNSMVLIPLQPFCCARLTSLAVRAFRPPLCATRPTSLARQAGRRLNLPITSRLDFITSCNPNTRASASTIKAWRF
jgi:predicted outer membrane repeat protein